MNLDQRLLSEARHVRVPLALTVGCSWLAGALLVGQAFLLSHVVAQVFLDGRTLSDVAWLLAALIALGLGRSALVWGSQAAAQCVAGAVKSDLRHRLSAQTLALGPAYAREERSGELVATAMEGIEALDAYFGQYLPQLVTAALVPLTILVFITPLDLISGAIMLATAPLIPIFMVLIGSQAERLTRRQWTSLSRMSAHFLDVLQGLATLKMLGRSRDQAETIALIGERYRQTTMAVLRVTFLSAFMLELIATLGTAIVAVGVGLRLLYGNLAFQQAFFVLILAPEFYMPLRLLGARFHAGLAGATAARRIYEVLETSRPPCPRSGRKVPEAGDRSSREAVPQAPTPYPSPLRGEVTCRLRSPRSLRGRSPALAPEREKRTRTRTNGEEARLPSIRFDCVHYAYAGGGRPALNGVSFELTPDQKTALVGPSGAGKSTIVQLLLRFVTPDHGAILVGDEPLEGIDPPVWRAQVAWVPQNPYLFHVSVAENIRLGRPEASMEQIVEAARLAHAHTFIEALTHGYETSVGERGARFSSGQAQRIALARAFLKDAPLLILDEASSALDPEHEALLQESVARLVRGRTVLAVAHRLSSVRDADQILVLADGRIAEAGAHAALMERQGLYRRLVDAGRGDAARESEG